jgi:hypothetical protein
MISDKQVTTPNSQEIKKIVRQENLKPEFAEFPCLSGFAAQLNQTVSDHPNLDRIQQVLTQIHLTQIHRDIG